MSYIEVQDFPWPVQQFFVEQYQILLSESRDVDEVLRTCVALSLFATVLATTAICLVRRRPPVTLVGVGRPGPRRPDRGGGRRQLFCPDFRKVPMAATVGDGWGIPQLLAALINSVTGKVRSIGPSTAAETAGGRFGLSCSPRAAEYAQPAPGAIVAALGSVTVAFNAVLAVIVQHERPPRGWSGTGASWWDLVLGVIARLGRRDGDGAGGRVALVALRRLPRSRDRRLHPAACRPAARAHAGPRHLRGGGERADRRLVSGLHRPPLPRLHNLRPLVALRQRPRGGRHRHLVGGSPRAARARDLRLGGSPSIRGRLLLSDCRGGRR